MLTSCADSRTTTNLPSLAPRMRRLLHPALVYRNHAENAKASALRPSPKHIPTTHTSPATHLRIRDLFCACCTTTNSTEIRHSHISISSGCFKCSRPAQIQVCTNSYPGHFALNPQSIVNGIRPSLKLTHKYRCSPRRPYTAQDADRHLFKIHQAPAN